MSNHAYVITKKKITHDMLLRALDAINADAFDNKLEIVQDVSAHSSWFQICVPVKSELREEEINFSFSLWLEAQRKIELRHPMNDFMAWVFVRIQHQLADYFQGYLRDDADNDKVMPDTRKYPTYKSWVIKGWNYVGKEQHTGWVLERFLSKVRGDWK